jgi:tRNA pseudouridine55 synthase
MNQTQMTDSARPASAVAIPQPSSDRLLAEICDEIRARKRFLLTSHSRPDGDSIGSQLAMAFTLDALGKHVRIFNADAAPEHYFEFPGMDRIEIVATVPAGVEADAVIVMECGDLSRTGVHGFDGRFIINIDHHVGNRMYGAINWFDESAAACGEMVFDVIRGLGVPLTLEIATHIYLAILTDTGSFHHSNITPRTFDICRQAVEAGVNPAAMARRVFDSNSFGKLKLIGALLDRMELLDEGRLAVLYLDDAMLEASGCTHNDTAAAGGERVRRRWTQERGRLHRERAAESGPRGDPGSPRHGHLARAPEPATSMNGALVVDKPPGPTSHDVVARVRRAVGISRIGHTGTLDPLATGVLPLVVGRATRLAQFLTNDEKEYVASVRFGCSTATYDAEERTVFDAEGHPVALRPPPQVAWIPESMLLEALPEFMGTYWQVPPPFSAKKVGGTPAYVLARLRKEVEIKPVQVTVHELELNGYADGLAQIRVVCSSGFYVRSLAHDLGQQLGCGAHLESLRRIRAGEFALPQSTTLDDIEREGTDAVARLVPMTELLSRLPHVVVNARGARRAAHGNALAAEDLWEAERTVPRSARPGPVRVLDADGALLAIGEPAAGGLLQPIVVLV